METHWDRTWRRFDEAFEKQRRRDMNETRRDALVGRVADTLDARSQLTATELSHRDIYQDANEIVEAVTRHRDAEIREALMAPGPHSAIRRAAAFHIGLMAYGTEQEAE